MRPDDDDGRRRGAGPATSTATRAPAKVASSNDFLARGELAESDARELAALKDQIRSATGRPCHSYKESGLRRRLAVRMRAHDIRSYGEYARLLREDASEYEELLPKLTIHVSRFFRNPDVWDAIAERVVPALFERDGRRIRIWSAGSAQGEEAYSIAILLAAHAEANGLESELERFEVVGTDIDAGVVEAARRAEYGGPALEEVSAELRRRWFEDGRPFRPRAEVRDLVRFERADLLRTSFPSRLDLILCRNLVIYLDRTAQPNLFDRFHDALEPEGFLVLGKVEALLGPTADRFRVVANRERIYQRL